MQETINHLNDVAAAVADLARDPHRFWTQPARQRLMATVEMLLGEAAELERVQRLRQTLLSRSA